MPGPRNLFRGARQQLRHRQTAKVLTRIHGRQHSEGSAIGTILNGSRKPRWNTTRATGTLILLPLGAFTGSMALGAASLLIGLLAIGFLAGAGGLIATELRERRMPAIAARVGADEDDGPNPRSGSAEFG